MKSKIVTVLLLAFALAGCSSFSIGEMADDNALWPAVEMSWSAVKADVERGGGDTTLFDAVITTRDIVQLRAIIGTFSTLRDAAVSGFDARVVAMEITLGVAKSLREQLSNFENALIQLAS